MKKIVLLMSLFLVMLTSCNHYEEVLPVIGIWQSDYPEITIKVTDDGGVYYGIWTKDGEETEIRIGFSHLNNQFYIFDITYDNIASGANTKFSGRFIVEENRMYYTLLPTWEEIHGVKEIVFTRVGDYEPPYPREPSPGVWRSDYPDITLNITGNDDKYHGIYIKDGEEVEIYIYLNYFAYRFSIYGARIYRYDDPHDNYYFNGRYIVENDRIYYTLLPIFQEIYDIEEIVFTRVVEDSTAEPNVDYITIRGKQYCTLLTELDLSGMNLQNEDIIPLKYMTNLETLILRSNQISNITPLSNLINLDILWLINNKISDVTPLSDLKNLTALNLSFNEIIDITPLSDLMALEALSLDGNPITDWSPVAHVSNVRGRP
jgi:hypothetical protein